MDKKDGRRWGVRPHQTRTKRVSFRVNLEELRELEIEATRQQVNLSELLRMAVDRLFGSGLKPS
jgi:hypothetical protein